MEVLLGASGHKRGKNRVLGGTVSRRRRVAAATTLVCALGLCGATGLASNAAYAAPKPQPTWTGPRVPGLPPSDYGAPVAPPPVELPPGAGTLPGAPGSGKDATASLDAVRKKIDSLYQQAGSATDAYNLASQRADQQSDQIAALTLALVQGRTKMASLKQQAGAAARAQYRGGGLLQSPRPLLTRGPQGFIDGLGRTELEQKNTNALLKNLTGTQSDLAADAQDAAAKWKRLQAGQQQKAKAKAQITQRITAAKRLQASLKDADKARLAALEEQAASDAQTKWLDSGALSDLSRSASAQGARAVLFAEAQVGTPYKWGAAGPDAFDCSGLTSQAWAAAGRPIPRTSQEQWRQLPHIPVADMRPGDLIIYYSDASHVAMYVGGGRIVEAPRPGEDVKLAGAGTMPILGVVRPDN
jgi:peptidoglycan DL-endopeptidase CwlO